MKKLFKRFKRQIFGFLACLIAIVPIFCLFCSADDDSLSIYPSGIADGSMIVTYTCNDYTSVGDKTYSYKIQVIPPNSFDSFVGQYETPYDSELTYFLRDGKYVTKFSAGGYTSSGYYVSLDRSFIIHNIPLSSDNYLNFKFFYDDADINVKPYLTIDITYRINNTSAVHNKTFSNNIFNHETNYDTSAFYSMLDVNDTDTIFIDTLIFRSYGSFRSTDEVIGFSFGLMVSYNPDSILTSSPPDISPDEPDDPLPDEPDDPLPDEPSTFPSEYFRDYTSWIAVAVGGFFAFELFPNFYLGGILVVVIAFSLVMWWLKMFGGG